MTYVPNSTSPSTNARFTDMGGGTLSEMMSAHIQFFYDPTTYASRAIFNGLPYLEIGSAYHALNTTPDILHVDFTNEMTRCYGSVLETLTDPVTGIDLTKVSVAGIMTLIKTAYDQEYNARAIAIANATALAEANALLTETKASPATNGTVAGFTDTETALAITFTDTSTAATGDTITGWSWIFGDNAGYSAIQNPTYTYAAAGTYTVSLVVTDSTGAKNFVTSTITVTT